MRISKQLREWLVKECGLGADATDDEVKTAAGEALAEGRLKAEDYQAMTKSERAEDASRISRQLTDVAEKLGKLTDALTAKAADPPPDDDEPDEDEVEKKVTPTRTKGKPKGKLYKMLSTNGSVEDGDLEPEIRVKKAAEMYYDGGKTALLYPATVKGGMSHPFAGQPVRDFSVSKDGPSRELNQATERDKAIVGAWGKFLVQTCKTRSRNLAWGSLPQHDRELIMYAMEEYPWCGATDGGNYADIVNRKLTGLECKALIDDSTSGGIEAVPLPFDDQIVATPILNGELAPLVNMVPLDKGRRIQGAAAGNPTSEWGGVDDTSISLFNTASYVSAFDTTIFRWQGSIKIGLDFISDTPVDFAQFLTQKYGDVLLQELDNVIATGDGTTQPEGISVKSGTTSVAWGAATSLSNYESLLFGVHARELMGAYGNTAVFCGTWTSYSRAKAIPVGASDARRLSQTVTMPSYNDRRWMERPYKINESLGNTKVFFAVLGRYRMYRRRGLTIRTSTEGDTLIRANELLLACTARYGGQLERGACAAVTSTAPS